MLGFYSKMRRNSARPEANSGHSGSWEGPAVLASGAVSDSFLGEGFGLGGWGPGRGCR